MKFPERLRTLRKEKGLYQKDIAKDLGVTTSAIGFYEQGKRKPDHDTLERLATYYNVSVDFLLGRTNERFSADKIKSALSDDQELADFWDKLKEREDLKLLFKQTKEMTPEGVRQIIRIIKAIEAEEQEKFNS